MAVHAFRRRLEIVVLLVQHAIGERIMRAAAASMDGHKRQVQNWCLVAFANKSIPV